MRATRRGRLQALALALVLPACGGSLVPAPLPADVARLASHYPGATLDELEHGRRIYLSRCTSCHAPIEPISIAAHDWPHEVREMSERAGLGSDEPSLVKYLVAQALRAESNQDSRKDDGR